MSAIIMCVDLNGVLLDTQAGLRAYAARRFGVIVPSELSCKDAVGRPLKNVVRGGRVKTFTAAEYRMLKDEFFNTAVFLEAPAIPAAAAALTELADLGFILQIVSNCATLTTEQITMWLARNDFPHEHIEIILTRRRLSKEPYLSRCDIVVDNEIEQLAPLVHQPHGPILIQFLSGVATSSDRTPIDSPIRSLRGWSEVLPFARDLHEPARVVQVA